MPERADPIPAAAAVPPAADPALEALARRLGRGGRVPRFLRQALTHPSYAHEHPPESHHERLAFLGDAVLGLVVAEVLYRRDPEAGPGPLTAQRAALVSTRGLATWAEALGLGPCLRLGRGEAEGGGRAKESILATAFEAVVGALYLDGGLEAVVPVVRRLMEGRGPAGGAAAPGGA